MPILRGSSEGILDIRGLLQIWWRAPCGGFLPLLALRGNSHRGEFEGHVEQNFTVHGWSCSFFLGVYYNQLYTWYPQQHVILFNNVWWNTHLSCNDFELSNLNNHFQVDVLGSRYLYVNKVSPYQIYQFVNRVTLEPSHSLYFCWYFLGRIGRESIRKLHGLVFFLLTFTPKKGLLNTDKHSHWPLQSKESQF